MAQIKAEIPTVVLLNQAFTLKALRTTLESSAFSIVHLATHGQFSSNAENTFILTWGERVTVNDLADILHTRNQNNRETIDLLVLSACQTATGDNRAP